MFAQQNKLKELFPQFGWELIETQTPNDNWIIEVWLIKSTWTPTNCYVFISFDVDPHGQVRNRKRENFWDLNLTLNQPDYWNIDGLDAGVRDDKVFSFFLRTHFEKNIPEIIDSLNELRIRFKNLE